MNTNISVSINDAEFYKFCEGMQITSAERKWLREQAVGIARVWHNPVIVNIGVAWGASCHCLRAGAPQAQLYGIEINPTGFKLARPTLLNLILLVGDSNIIWKDFHLAIHLLFIDGCHHREYVLSDIDGWTSKVAAGGIVAFHDYAPSALDLQFFPDLVGVKNAVDEWQSKECLTWGEVALLILLRLFCVNLT